MRRLLRPVLSLALLGGLLWYVGGAAAVLRPLADAELPWIAAGFVVSVLDRVLMTYKWTRLLASRGATLGVSAGMKIYCAAMVWGMFLPSTLGPDAIRVYLTTRQGLAGATVIASIAVERILGFIASLAYALLALVILDRVLDPRFADLDRAGAVTLAIAVTLFTLSLNPRFLDGALRRLPARVAGTRLVQRGRELYAVYVGFGGSRRVLVTFFALTVLEQFVNVVFTWCIARAVGLEVGLVFMAGVLPLTMLVSRLPISVDGIGVFEAVFVLFMGLGGVPAAEAVSVALVARVVQTFSWLPWWLAQSVETGESVVARPFRFGDRSRTARPAPPLTDD